MTNVSSDNPDRVTPCPLPIDWWEMLHRGEAPSANEHFSSCPSCREVVARIEASVAGELNAVDLDSALTAAATDAPHWHAASTDPQAAQIWLTRSALLDEALSYQGLPRLFVLLLALEQEADGSLWADVAPLLTDTDRLTALDVRLADSETTLGVPLGVYCRYQTRLRLDQLEACLGSLTSSGKELLHQVMAGEVPGSRLGPALQADWDWRLAELRWLEEAMDTLGSLYGLRQVDDDAGTDSAGPPPVKRRHHPVAGKRAVRTIHLVREPQGWWGFVVQMLVRSTFLPDSSSTRWRSQVDDCLLEASLGLSHIRERRLLCLRIDEVQHCPGQQAVVRMRKSDGELLDSEPFEPLPGRQAVFPADVSPYAIEDLRVEFH